MSLATHAAVVVPASERDRIRAFYRDLLYCTLMRTIEVKDDVRIDPDFYVAFVYEQ